jgi:hypothetical protein
MNIGSKPKVVCIICPVRHADSIGKVASELERAGSVALWSPYLIEAAMGGEIAVPPGRSTNAQTIFRCKIAMADEVLVIGGDEAIDDHIRNDVLFAKAMGKRFRKVPLVESTATVLASKP